MIACEDGVGSAKLMLKHYVPPNKDTMTHYINIVDIPSEISQIPIKPAKLLGQVHIVNVSTQQDGTTVRWIFQYNVANKYTITDHDI